MKTILKSLLVSPSFMKLKEIRSECDDLVRQFLTEDPETRTVFPNFYIGGIGWEGTAGDVYLYHKACGKDPIFSSKYITYNSIAELALLIECLTNSWKKMKGTTRRRTTL